MTFVFIYVSLNNSNNNTNNNNTDVKFVSLNIRSSFATIQILLKVRKWPQWRCIVKATA